LAAEKKTRASPAPKPPVVEAVKPEPPAAASPVDEEVIAVDDEDTEDGDEETDGVETDGVETKPDEALIEDAMDLGVDEEDMAEVFDSMDGGKAGEAK